MITLALFLGIGFGMLVGSVIMLWLFSGLMMLPYFWTKVLATLDDKERIELKKTVQEAFSECGANTHREAS